MPPEASTVLAMPVRAAGHRFGPITWIAGLRVSTIGPPLPLPEGRMDFDQGRRIAPGHRCDEAVAAAETVWMQLPSARPSSRTRRSAAICMFRLASSTTVAGQTAAMIAPGRRDRLAARPAPQEHRVRASRSPLGRNHRARRAGKDRRRADQDGSHRTERRPRRRALPRLRLPHASKFSGIYHNLEFFIAAS